VPNATFSCSFPNLPVRLISATLEHGDAVLRELALMSAGEGRSAFPLSQLGSDDLDLAPILDAVHAARLAGVESIDLIVDLPSNSEAAATERLALIEEGERLAAEGSVLTPPPLPEIVSCRRWLIGQIVHQARGAQAEPWQLVTEAAVDPTAALLPTDLRAVLDAVAVAIVVADHTNRVVFANREAGELLGWDPDLLTGQRLTAIIPPELREAHLAGFTRYELTGERRVIGTSVPVAALRYDGSLVEVELRIRAVPRTSRGPAFVASITPRHADRAGSSDAAF
jgi:PAS domain S-box-containing protein